MMEKIDKLKQGKIDPNELLKSFSKESPQTIGIVNSSSLPRVNNTSNSNNNNSRITSNKGASVKKEPHRRQ